MQVGILGLRGTPGKVMIKPLPAKPKRFGVGLSLAEANLIDAALQLLEEADPASSETSTELRRRLHRSIETQRSKAGQANKKRRKIPPLRALMRYTGACPEASSSASAKPGFLHQPQRKSSDILCAKSGVSSPSLRAVASSHDAPDLHEPRELTLIEHEIAHRFAKQFEFCALLRETVLEARPPKREATDEPRALLLVILQRSIDSFDAIVHLCRVGLPVQALMVARSLFEDMVSGFWLTVDERQALALERIRDQGDFLVLLSNDSIRAYPHRFSIDPDEHPDLEARRPEFQEKFGTYGERTWVGSLYNAVQDIKPRWEELGGDADTLSIYYAAVHRHANLHLHNTATSLTRGLRGLGQSGERKLLDDADALDLDIALRAAYMCLAGYSQLVVTQFGHDRSKVQAMTEEAENFFLSADAPKILPKLGRNDLCWCGSGKKFKRCHGA